MPRISFWLLLSVAAVAGCNNVSVDGDVKMNTVPLSNTAAIVAACLIGAGVCWLFRKRERTFWIGIVGLPLFAIFTIVGSTQLRAIVDRDHFEVRSMKGTESHRFAELTTMQVVYVYEGKGKYGNDVIRHYINLHKRNGTTERIVVGDILRPLWNDVVANAQRQGVVYDTRQGLP